MSEESIKETINKLEPPAWDKKYLIIPSITKEVPENIGIKPNKESSNPIQTTNQLSLLTTRKTPTTIVVKKTNQDGYNFNIISKEKRIHHLLDVRWITKPLLRQSFIRS